MITTFTGRKGGVTKTTSSGHTAYALTSPGAESGASVLLVDTDAQHQCSSIFGLEPGMGLFNYLLTGANLAACVQVTRRKRLLLLPGSQMTIALVGALKAQIDAKQLLIGDIAARFRALANEVGHVVIDTPASGVLQEAAVLAADLVILPTGLERLDLESVPVTLGMVEALCPGKRVRILPALMDNRIADHKNHLRALRRQYGELVADPIHRRAAVAEALTEGKLIFETNPDCVVAQEYAALAQRIIDLKGEL